MNLGRYCVQRALERRGGDGEDLLSVLGNAEINGRKLTEGELFHNGFQYIIGGLETTRNAISGGLLALIQHPAECAKLISNPSLMPTAIEEILRWSSPITHIARVATRDSELARKTIREGDLVACGCPRGIETRRLSTIRIALTLNAPPTNTSPSAGASISAPARIWRGWNFVL
jgi:cholest-4-en-3-one 26-monooxygenase